MYPPGDVTQRAPSASLRLLSAADYGGSSQAGGFGEMAYSLFMKLCTFTRRYKGKLLGLSSLGLFAVNISYHVFPEQTFRKVYQGWTKGELSQLNDKQQRLFQVVLEETHVGSSSGYTPFSAYGFQPVSVGIPWLPQGCLVGIPANYNHTEENGAGIVNRVLVINGQEVDWNSEAGTSLRDSLTLSEDAQKFSLAREAVHAQINGPILQASVAPLCLSGVCLSSVACKQLLGLYSGPVLLRGVFNLVAVVVGFTLYFLCDDALNQWLEFKSDQKVATISKSYSQGGLEFYDKILARNQILRAIMGKQGEAIYAPSGNLFPKQKLRLKHAPYTARRDRVRQTLEMQQ
ncbi:transmembrane protein 177 [Mixophyes fleayi]|uniref:transmembrane protein 177 n=1 Tax=Mixophyes fleayi TaxID=3061075 RepID=UPI003F4DF887